MTISARVMDVDQTSAKIVFCALSEEVVIGSVVDSNKKSNSGLITITQPVDRYSVAGGTGGATIAPGIMKITNLSPWTRYNWIISQNFETIYGSFWTMPGDTITDFGFIVATCDNNIPKEPRASFTYLREIMKKASEASEPVIMMFHIDDLAYVDSWNIVDSSTGILADGQPQITGKSYGYAAAWAAYYGLLNSYPKWQNIDRQWVYRNLPCVASGGDHAIENNHCRTTNDDCNRGPTDPVPNLESIAKAEWDAFIGIGNPPMLRTNKWYWAKTLGPLSFAVFDYQLDSIPSDPITTDPNAVGYGAVQIADIMAIMDTPETIFKCFAHEAPLTSGTFKQPWQQLHPNEANNWKTSAAASANLNGTISNHFHVFGDYHQPQVLSYDEFWAFCPGVLIHSGIQGLDTESEDEINKHGVWSGQTRWAQAPWNTIGATANRRVGGFFYFRVLSSRSPKEIQCYFVDGASGQRASPIYQLISGSVDNQWNILRGGYTA